ncbi:MAG: molybdenum cofactor guanylyltransferase [Helicobacteraceae bacterium 4484_230]|nr:MAG: molybdenum cofactor guanylyltransferase [Helicobacteraceae bacterium 4484_230]
MFDITCIIFAGGKSSRMGRDKSLLPFGGFETLAQYQYERLKKIFNRVCISAKEADKFDFEADVIPDIVETGIFAPTAGFVSVFEHLDDDRIFVLSVDTPFVGREEISALIKADKPSLDAVVAKTDSGIHPMCGIYHRSLLRQFREMLYNDNHRLGQLLKSSQADFIFFGDDSAFANLNQPHEYEEALLFQQNRS